MRKIVHVYEHIISTENLLSAWKEFLRDKRARKDVEAFSVQLMPNILALHNDLATGLYRHGKYYAFAISDPKPRQIHKASVRDRLLHHALYRVLYRTFDERFIYDSYSCRIEKGTHRALSRFELFGRRASENNAKTVWVLKCDIRKFFASIDHETLFSVLERHVEEPELLGLLRNIVQSFHGTTGNGLPLGNLTSQLLVNVYMNEFDQHMKHVLKVKYYLRYADDFAIMSQDKAYLENLLLQISDFIETTLKLSLHPDKVFIKTLASGVDFLGWVHFPDHRVLRTATKRRMLKNITEYTKPEALASYKGMLSHGNGYKLTQMLEEKVNTSTHKLVVE